MQAEDTASAYIKDYAFNALKVTEHTGEPVQSNFHKAGTIGI